MTAPVSSSSVGARWQVNIYAILAASRRLTADASASDKCESVQVSSRGSCILNICRQEGIPLKNGVILARCNPQSGRSRQKLAGQVLAGTCLLVQDLFRGSTLRPITLENHVMDSRISIPAKDASWSPAPAEPRSRIIRRSDKMASACNIVAHLPGGP